MFENDGCTLWFDSWFGIPVRHCCDVHDERFAYGTSFAEWVSSNIELVKCGFESGADGWAILAGIGLCLFSYPLFRFGKKKTKDGNPT